MKRFVAYAFVPWLRPGTRAALRLPWIAATLVLCAAIAVTAVLAVPQPPATAVFALDASYSVGLAYENEYIPQLLGALPSLVGRRVVIIRMGGVQETIFDGVLQESDFDWLRPLLLASRPFDPEVQGSPISQESVTHAAWLAQQTGRRLLVVMTDGIEQALGPLQLTPGSAEGVHALVLFPQGEHPHVGEALKAAGASVVVATEPGHATGELATATTGVPPLLQWLGERLLWLVLLAIVCLRLSLGAVIEPLKVEESLAEAPLPEALSLPTEEDILPPPVVTLTASVEGQPRLFTRKRLICGGDDCVIVARPGSPRVDLRLPLQLLGQATEVAVRLLPLDLEHLRVTNLGRTWVVAGRRRLNSGEEAEIRVSDEVLLAPEVTLTFDVKMEEDDAIRAAIG